MTTTPRAAEPTSGGDGDLRISHVLIRWLGLLGGTFAVYDVGVMIAALLNATVWHHDSPVDGYGLPTGAGVTAGLACALVAVLLGRRRVSWRLLCGWNLAWSMAGLLVLGYGALNAFGAIWYDMTFAANGHVGASFAVLGVWFAWFILFPVGTLFLALGLGRR